MITQLTDNLYRVVSDLDIMITRGFYTDINLQYEALKYSIDEFKRGKEVLYKELFEQWCKEDFYRFCRLFNIIQNKPNNWQEGSIRILPDFPILFNDLCYIYDEIKARNPDIVKDVEAERLNKPTDRCKAVTLPDELATTEGFKIFEQARDLGLIDRGYKWLKGLQLLACFAREMSLKLSLGKGCNSDGTQRISWKPFERLFNIPNGKLRANYNDVQKTGQQPADHSLIDRIFN